MDGPIDPALHEHYARGEERDRLTEARGMLEFERTTEIVLRQLPAPPLVVADIGGVPGGTHHGWPSAAIGSSTATSCPSTSTSSVPSPTRPGSPQR
jgi:hypothetical protein